MELVIDRHLTLCGPRAWSVHRRFSMNRPRLPEGRHSPQILHDVLEASVAAALFTRHACRVTTRDLCSCAIGIGLATTVGLAAFPLTMSGPMQPIAIALPQPKPAPHVMSTPRQVPALAISMPAPVGTLAPVTVFAPPADNPGDHINVSRTDVADAEFGPTGSIWRDAGQEVGVDPLLLYSIALVETRHANGDHMVAPTPYIARINHRLISGNRADVEKAIRTAMANNGLIQDVGVMQVYYPAHKGIAPDPVELLDPATNTLVAAEILRSCLQADSDPIMAVGHYHSFDPVRARYYGKAVWTVYHRLERFLGRDPVDAKVSASLLADVANKGE